VQEQEVQEQEVQEQEVQEQEVQEQEVQEQLALAHSKFLAGLGPYDIQYPRGD
jgi:hypothetical protein